MFTLLVSVARASAVYPGHISDQLAMPCVPQCTLCHQDNLGGVGTVVSAFGAAMTDRGLTGGAQFDLLDAALAALETDAVDSDADSTTDVDELRVGDNPNGGDAFCDSVTPIYGCFAHTPAAATVSGITATLLALLLRRRR